MNEIEKMYENAHLHKCTNIGNFCKHIGNTCERCKKHQYPPFTAEKQLGIVKMLLFSIWWMNLKRLQFGYDFKSSLAKLVNELWQDLTEEEKQQVKGILE